MDLDLVCGGPGRNVAVPCSITERSDNRVLELECSGPRRDHVARHPVDEVDDHGVLVIVQGETGELFKHLCGGRPYPDAFVCPLLRVFRWRLQTLKELGACDVGDYCRLYLGYEIIEGDSHVLPSLTQEDHRVSRELVAVVNKTVLVLVVLEGEAG